jgi:hypothetical protein
MLTLFGRSALVLCVLGCSGGPDITPGTKADGYCGTKTPGLLAAAGKPTNPVAPLTEEPVAGSSCNAVERSYPIASATHVEVCSSVDYGTNPPSSGHHYPLFPQYGVYDNAIPRGFWVHSLEHGGVVFTYSCKDCAMEVDAATSLIASIGPAPICCSAAGCASTVSNQIVMTPDAGIPTRWAASSWGFTLTADCFEPEIFQNFVVSQRDNGSPELICDNTFATDVTQPASK